MRFSALTGDSNGLGFLSFGAGKFKKVLLVLAHCDSLAPGLAHAPRNACEFNVQLSNTVEFRPPIHIYNLFVYWEPNNTSCRDVIIAASVGIVYLKYLAYCRMYAHLEGKKV
jgi:hypothetical protein